VFILVEDCDIFVCICRCFFGAIPFVEGAATGDFGIEAGTLFFDSVLAFPTLLGYWLVLYEDYEKSRFYTSQGKRDKGTALGYFIPFGFYSFLITCFRLY
jgi:hypothetical protein